MQPALECEGAPCAPRVLVSIVHWNGGASTLASIESVLAEDHPHIAICVVDNGSTDGIADVIESRWPDIQVVRNAINTGFTGGQNRGIAVAMASDADHVLLLNQDAILVPGCIGRMVALASADPAIGLVSPMIYFADEPERVQFCGSWLDRKAMAVGYDGDLDIVRVRNADPDVTMCLWGTALLIRREVIEQIGVLDDRLFAYFEDTDYCVRASDAGWRNRMCLGAGILHEGHATRYTRAPNFFYFTVRNEMLFWRKALSWRAAIRLRLVCVARGLRQAAKLRDAGGRDTQVAACMSGLWDALLHRTGCYDPARRCPGWFSWALLRHPYFLADLLELRWSSMRRRAPSSPLAP